MGTSYAAHMPMLVVARFDGRLWILVGYDPEIRPGSSPERNLITNHYLYIEER